MARAVPYFHKKRNSNTGTGVEKAGSTYNGSCTHALGFGVYFEEAARVDERAEEQITKTVIAKVDAHGAWRPYAVLGLQTGGTGSGSIKLTNWLCNLTWKLAKQYACQRTLACSCWYSIWARPPSLKVESATLWCDVSRFVTSAKMTQQTRADTAGPRT